MTGHDAVTAHAVPAGCERPLTLRETVLVERVFGRAVDCRPVRIRRRKWFPFQPVETVMAPMGHIHFHPRSSRYRDDFARADLGSQGLFIHEMTHVWQSQQLGTWYLPLHRHPFCPYAYTLVPGWRLEDYGIEQQAEIVRHVFLKQNGAPVPGTPSLEAYAGVLPFGPHAGIAG